MYHSITLASQYICQTCTTLSCQHDKILKGYKQKGHNHKNNLLNYTKYVNMSENHKLMPGERLLEAGIASTKAPILSNMITVVGTFCLLRLFMCKFPIEIPNLD